MKNHCLVSITIMNNGNIIVELMDHYMMLVLNLCCSSQAKTSDIF